MESIIANLLAAFEQGRIDRRQLVQRLVLAATGGAITMAPRGLSAAEAPTETSEVVPARAFRTVGIDHISYAVSDYGRSRDFYADLMGWEVMQDDGERQAVMSMGDVGLMIVRNARQVPDEGPTGVINHIAFSIADFDTDAVREDLQRRGLDPRRDQGGPPGYDSYHVLDPDGWDVQIGT